MRRQREKKESRRKTRSASVEIPQTESLDSILKRRSSFGKVEKFDSLSLRKCSSKGCREYTVNFISEHGREGVSLPVCEKCVEKKGFVICALCETEAVGEPCNHTTKRKGSRRSRRGSRRGSSILQRQQSDQEEEQGHPPISIEQLLKAAAEQLRNNNNNDE